MNNEELVWIKVAEHNSCYSSTSMEEFIDSTGKFCKQLWNDGYEEIFEIEKP
jgi:hypothetical protein